MPGKNINNTQKKYRLGTVRFKPSSKIFFTDRFKAVLLLWIIYVIFVLFCYAFMHVCLLMPCGRLLGKG